jgi:UDP-glucose/iron transport system ATP-binding protein
MTSATSACSAGSPAELRLRLCGLRSRLAGPFDLTLSAGECVAVTGPSGAGKSLLLRMIADLDPNEGEVWLDGRERGSFPAPAWRQQVVYNAAEAGWWAERVAAHFPAPALAAARTLAPRLGLDPALLDAPVIRLSTGERQRLALLRALAGSPPVLLLDEPTGALDEANTARVEVLLAERLRAGTAILMVTHSPAQAARLGRRHLRLADRRLTEA